MDFKLATPFMEAFEELDKLNEATDPAASKKFWAAAKTNKIDADAFHAAYDDELKELGLMDVFTAEGAFTNKGIYGRIKAAKEANPDSWAVKALSRLWALRYVDNAKFPCELEADKAAAAEAQRRAEQKRQEEEAAKLAKQEKIKEYQETLKTYISKVDAELVAAYEKVAGVSAVEGITLEHKGEEPGRTWKDKPVLKFGVMFKEWNRYYSINETKFLDEAAMIKLLTEGLKNAADDIRVMKGSEKFKTIDIFKSNPDATVILLGDSGNLYELRRGYRGGIMVNVNDEQKQQPGDVVDEPYEVIYTRAHWSDDNRSTYRDSHSASYYSWNSKYEDKLGKRIPTEYGREDGYIGSYTETKKIENPSSNNYSHADGIDSWAEVYNVSGATD